MRADKVVLAGVDLTDEPYGVGEGKPGDLRAVPQLFNSALPQLEARGMQVRKIGGIGRLSMFKTLAHDALERWLLHDK